MATAQRGDVLYALLIASGGITAFAATRYAWGGGRPAIYNVGLVVDNRGAHAAEDVLRATEGWASLARGRPITPRTQKVTFSSSE